MFRTENSKLLSRTVGVASLWLACVACGRSGFVDVAFVTNDPPLSGDELEEDVTVEIPAPEDAGVVSGVVSLASRAGGFDDLEVDWSRNLAYVTRLGAAHCLSVFDVTDSERPRLVGSALEGDSCAGIALFAGGSRLLVSSTTDGEVSSWNLGGSPAALVWSRRGSVPMGAPRRVSVLETTPAAATAYVGVAAEGSTTHAITALPLTADASGFGAPLSFAAPCSTIAPIAGGDVVVCGCAPGTSPGQAFVLRRADMSITAGTSFDAGIGFVASAASSDGTRLLIGGTNLRVTLRTTSTLAVGNLTSLVSGEIRDAAFLAGSALALTVSSDRNVDLWDATDVFALVHVRRTLVHTASGELRGIALDDAGERVVMVTSTGQLITAHLSSFLPAP